MKEKNNHFFVTSFYLMLLSFLFLIAESFRSLYIYLKTGSWGQLSILSYLKEYAPKHYSWLYSADSMIGLKNIIISITNFFPLCLAIFFICIFNFIFLALNQNVTNTQITNKNKDDEEPAEVVDDWLTKKKLKEKELMDSAAFNENVSPFTIIDQSNIKENEEDPDKIISRDIEVYYSLELILFLLKSDKTINLNKFWYLKNLNIKIGKSNENDIILLDDNISDVHAHIYGRTIFDLNSKSGVFVNGNKIESMSAHTINEDDVITIGLFSFQVIKKKIKRAALI